MGAFDRGFGMGLQIWDSRERTKRLAEQDKRESEAHTLRMQQGQAGLALTQQQLDAGAREAAKAQELAGLRQQLNGAPAVDMAGPVNPDLPEGMEGRKAAGLYKPATPAATGAQRYGLMSQMAALQGDYSGAANLDAVGRKVKTQDFLKQSALQWKGMTPDQRKAARSEFFDNPSVPMYSTEPSKDGKFQVIVKGADKPVELDAADEVAMFTAARLYEQDPMAALEMMRNTSDRLRLVADQLNKTLFQVTGVNNDVVAKGLSAANDAARTDIARQGLGIQREELGVRREQVLQGRMGSVQYFRDPKSGVVEARIPTMVGGKMTWQKVEMPQGMVPFNRQQIDPAMRAKIMADYVAAGMTPEQAAMQTDQDLGGGIDMNAIIEGLKKLQEGKKAPPEKVGLQTDGIPATVMAQMRARAEEEARLRQSMHGG